MSPTVPPLPSDEDSEKEPDEREHGSIFKSTGTRRAQLLLTSKDIIDDEDSDNNRRKDAQRWKRARALARRKLGGPRTPKDIEEATDALAPLYELEYESTEEEVGQTAYAVFNRMIIDMARAKEEQRDGHSNEAGVAVASARIDDEDTLSLSEDGDDQFDSSGRIRRSPRRRDKTLETMTMRDVFAAFTKERLETVERRRRRG